jgi:DNA-binding CsgD family transcriptional regulator
MQHATLTKLKDQDLRDILSTVDIALNCSDLDELRRQLLHEVQRIFWCDKSTFFLAHKTHEEIDFAGMLTQGYSDDVIVPYIQRYQGLDPFIPKLFDLPAVVTIDEIVPFRELTRGELYNDFMRVRSIHYHMVVILRSGQRVLGAIGLSRPRHAANFTSREKSKAGFLAQYIEKILGNKMLLDQWRRHSYLFESVATELANRYIIVLDERLEPIYVDKRAETILFPSGRVSKSMYVLPEEIYLQCEELRKTVLETGESGGCKQFTLKMDQAGRQMAVMLGFISIVVRQGTPLGFLICLGSGDPIPHLNQRLERLGLTKREREVAHLICKGMKNEDISDRLYISSRTVENHIKSIYAKLDVHNRASLIHHLMAIS